MKDLLKYVDRLCFVQFEAIQVMCRCLDVKITYGKVRFEITPRVGAGKMWVEESRVKWLPRDEELREDEPSIQ
jgi:hypothetical protein